MRYQQVKSLFQDALELEPQARGGFLERACGGDGWLRARVDELLAAAESADSILRIPAPSDDPGQPDDPDAPGDRIGAYRLVERLGSGRVGVWVAEPSDPRAPHVALKIAPRDHAGARLRARMELERRTLGRLDHPGIVKLLDAGEGSDGRPYLAMELVRGAPLTHHCDLQRLDLEQRLRLFLQVCHAVEHMHGKGIVHRDLRPPNVRVSLRAGAPATVLIGLGIAQARESTVEDASSVLHGLLANPWHMAPEQTEVPLRELDPRADVYALAVLLYELLTGELPFQWGPARTASFQEVLREIREEPPQPPSARVRTRGEDAAARRRGLELAALALRLEGELDRIVLKGLQKDPERRYGDVQAFAGHVRRYLDREPGPAAPPRLGERLRRYLRGNPGG